jgi:hypothetical protein
VFSPGSEHRCPRTAAEKQFPASVWARCELELAPLRMIRDNYEKIVIAGSSDNPMVHDVIKIKLLTDFLLED